MSGLGFSKFASNAEPEPEPKNKLESSKAADALAAAWDGGDPEPIRLNSGHVRRLQYIIDNTTFFNLKDYISEDGVRYWHFYVEVWDEKSGEPLGAELFSSDLGPMITHMTGKIHEILAERELEEKCQT